MRLLKGVARLLVMIPVTLLEALGPPARGGGHVPPEYTGPPPTVAPPKPPVLRS